MEAPQCGSEGDRFCLSCLPLDILEIIFRQFFVRPRILVVSIVCKTWRSAGLKATHSIPHYFLSDCDPLPELPLSVWDPESDVPVTKIPLARITKINSLKLIESTSHESVAAAIANLSSLAKLVIACPSNSFGLHYELINNNAKTLTRLLFQHGSEPLCLRNLPRLHKLKINKARLEEASLVEFLTLQMPTIKTFNIDTALLDPICHLSAPLLEDVCLRNLSALSEAALTWLASLKSLTSLSVSFGDKVQLCPLHFSLISRFTTCLEILRLPVLPENSDGDKWVACLTSCPKLSYLLFESPYSPQLTADLFRGLAPQLTNLALPERVLLVLSAECKRTCTRLRSLQLFAGTIDPVWWGNWHAPRLRELTCRLTIMDVHQLDAIVAQFPRLQEVTVSRLDGELKLLEFVLTKAEMKGLMMLEILNADTQRAKEIMAVARQFKWLRLHIDTVEHQPQP